MLSLSRLLNFLHSQTVWLYLQLSAEEDRRVGGFRGVTCNELEILYENKVACEVIVTVFKHCKPCRNIDSVQTVFFNR